VSRKKPTAEPDWFLENEKKSRLVQQSPREWNFLYAAWSFNNKRYRLKERPDVFCDLTRSTDVGSILVGTWKWIGPDDKQGGPHLTVEDCLREMTRAFSVPWNSNPRYHWRGVARTVGGPRLRLVP